LHLRFLDRFQPLGLLILRVVVGAAMIAHGSHKVFGGMGVHVKMVTGIGMPAFMAYVSAYAEFIGGMLLVAGLLTRIAAIAICINMMVAVLKVHLHQGFVGGYEYPLALSAMAFTVMCFGPGPVAVDWVIGGTGRSRR
jgi:putative oxidoreductase